MNEIMKMKFCSTFENFMLAVTLNSEFNLCGLNINICMLDALLLLF